VIEANKAMKAALARAEGQFLAGANPVVASADLQEILKNLAKEQGVQMSSTKALPPREAGLYLQVPVQVELTATINQLVTLLYHLEHHKKLLFITDLDINASRWVKGENKDVSLQISMVISGVIKKRGAQLNCWWELKPINFLLLAGIAFLLVAIVYIWWGSRRHAVPVHSR